MGSKSSAYLQERPKLSPSDLVLLLFSSIFLAWLCLQGCRILARRLGWQEKEEVKLIAKMSVLEIAGPLLGRQKPPGGC